MALDSISTIGSNGLSPNSDRLVVYRSGGSEAAISAFNLINSSLSLSGVYLDPINQRVGIGTNAPTSPLTVIGASQFGNAIGSGSVETFDGYYSMSFGKSTSIYNPNSNYTRIFMGSSQTFIDNASGNFQFRSAGDTVLNLQSGNLAVGNSSTTPTARLQVKGSGSTSATTSLLVQNSSGTTALKVDDDTNVYVGGSNGGGLTIGNAVGGQNYYVNINASLPGAGNRGGIKWGGFAEIRNVRKFSGGNDSTISIINAGTELITIQQQTAAGATTNNVGINNTSPDASAILDVASTTKGFLPPRMSTAQKNAIATPATGLMVYDTDLNRPCFYSGSAWVTL